MNSALDALTSATPEIALLAQRLFHISVSPTVITLEKLLELPHDKRALVVLHAAVPYNSMMRVDPSHNCSFVFFQERTASTSMLVQMARALCAIVHHESAQREQRDHYRNAGRTRLDMRRCCRIVSGAQLWLFHNRASNEPLLPCCSSPDCHAEGEEPSVSIDAPITEYPLLEKISEQRPDVDRLSHSAHICCTDLEGMVKQLEATIPLTAVDECGNCENRRNGGFGDARVPKGPFTLCRHCLAASLARVQRILKFARIEGVRCTKRASCNCIYRHYSERAASVINLDGVARPNDATYELLGDSIYDARSPLAADTLERFPETMRPLIENARIGKPLSGGRHEVPTHLAGFGLSVDYDTMLERARDVYGQPTGPTLANIALANEKHQPLFGAEGSMDAALAWLPRCVHQIVHTTTRDGILAEVRRSLAPGQLLIATRLERLLYEELRMSRNRLATMSRVVGLVLETPLTLRKYYGMILHLAAIVGMLDVCHVTAQKISERNLAAFVADEASKPVPAQKNKKRQRVVVQQQKKKQQPKKPTTAAEPSAHALRRLLAHAKEPPPQPLPLEEEKKRLDAASKEFVPMTPEAHQCTSLWPTMWTATDTSVDEDEEIDEAAEAMTHFASEAALLGGALWNEIDIVND